MIAVSTLAVATLSACGGGGGSSSPGIGGSSSPGINVEITRTSYGVPHIVGKDLRSVSFGLAYAYAQDNICIAANRFLTVAGERSKYLGASAAASPGSTLSNLRSDFYYRNVLDQDAVDKAYPNTVSTTNDAISGYVAGYNRFLADAKDADFGDCANMAWAKRALTDGDLKRHLLALATQSGAGAFIAGIADAVPPAPVGMAASKTGTKDRLAMNRREAKQMAQLLQSSGEFARQFDERPMGSNGTAFGGATTTNSRGILVGNPHFPWDGALRFYQSHVQIPGVYNVMGAGLGGVPLPQIGFNNDLAWTNTVSTGRRYTLFELSMNGKSYVMDGVTKPLTEKQVTVDVLENGVITPQTRTYYRSEHGPIVVSTALGANWTANKAFAIRDANIDNGRIIEQGWKMGQATSVEQLRSILGSYMASPWVNTLAADRSGNVLYADYSVVPNVSASHLTSCGNSAQAQTLAVSRTFLLDGSKANCNWPIDPAAASPGIMSAASLPSTVRIDYVNNSNESAWLPNPSQLLTGFSPLVGDQAKAQSLRTRMAFTEIQDRLAGLDGLHGNKVSPDSIETVFFGSRMYSAELVLPSLLTLCESNPTVTATNGTAVNLTAACGVLRTWDRRAKTSSVGVPVFREFWRRAQTISGLYSVPFDATSPVTTPRSPAIATPAVATAMLKALADGVLALNSAGVPLTANLGSVQYVTRNGVKMPQYGGDEFEGVYNKMTPPGAGLGAGGYTSISSGSSYIQIVSFEPSGVVARGLLTYSQSTNSASPYFADQTQQFSNGAFVKLPYTDAEIAADPKRGATLTLVN